MIVNAIATGLLALIGWIVSLLPTGAPWAPDLSIAQHTIGSFYAIDAYVPITEAMQLITISIAIMNARFAFAVGTWVWKRIRG